MTEYLDILKRYWGYDSFRGIQEQVIRSVGEGRDTLGLMPTGGGKSICFQVPALAREGLCLVITPLISLMKDQVEQLRKLGIKADTIHAGMMPDDLGRVLDNCILGNYKFLYLSPERLGSELFQAKLPYLRRVVSLVCVDEAHCVSQWGYDFRPSYMNIASMRETLGHDIPILALTATATPKVATDIQRQLGFRQTNVLSMSFERKNIVYVVRETENKPDELVHILQRVTNGSAIVYTRSRSMTAELSKLLRSNGIEAENYHAGLTQTERDLRQSNWSKGRCRVMVATNAFGMGINKSDVRIVVHYNAPNDLESYYQEAGRAGRDGETAYAVLLYNRQDGTVLRRRVNERYPDIQYVRDTYDNICYFYQIGIGEGRNRNHFFSIEKFCHAFKQFPVQADSALKLLDSAGYLRYETDREMKSQVRFVLRKEELYRLHEGGHDMEAVMTTLMRNYTGIFATFVLIDEMHMSHLTGISPERIYDLLTELANRRIIDYIPHNNQPTVMLLSGRVEGRHLHLPPEVYDIRKEEYRKRIEKMVDYASSQNRCRSRMILNYFGEKSDHECGQCDVCLRRKKKGLSSQQITAIRQSLFDLLADKQKHKISELNSLPWDRKHLDEVLHMMVEEEELTMDNSFINLYS